MSRCKPISELIDSYKEHQDIADSNKKLADGLNKDIKNYLVNNDLESAKSDKWVAKITKSQRSTLNEDQAIKTLKEELSKDDLSKVIKTKEYIDEDALEGIIYDGSFDASKLEKCTENKEILTLRISAVK